MRKLCRNCGAKIPKKSDVCKKCGEPYEYIDLNLDPETEKALQVEKPSNMLNICILILSILIFIYSLVLIYLNFTNNRENSKNKLPDASVSDTQDPDDSSHTSDTSSVVYNAIDFIGQPFSEVKKVLGEQYSIKLSDTILVSYVNFPVTLSTTDENLSDDSVISKIIVKDNAQITPVVTADMTYDELKIVLGLTKPAPELDVTDAFYYVRKIFENDNYQMEAAFKFDNEATDKAPLEVILTCEELTSQKEYGIVTGLDEDSWLNVRSQPATDANELVQLYNGTRVQIVSRYSDEWLEVETEEGVTGFAAAEFIISESEAAAAPVTSETETSEEDSEENTEEDTYEEESYDEYYEDEDY